VDFPHSTATAGMAVPMGAGPGLKPFACLRFFRRPEGVLPRIEIRASTDRKDTQAEAMPQALSA